MSVYLLMFFHWSEYKQNVITIRLKTWSKRESNALSPPSALITDPLAHEEVGRGTELTEPRGTRKEVTLRVRKQAKHLKKTLTNLQCHVLT